MNAREHSPNGGGHGLGRVQLGMMSRTRVRYSGRVQGVGFRVTARSVAHGRAVTGWVRNEADGSVLLEVQGAGEAVGAFLDALRTRMGDRIVQEFAAAGTVVDGEASFVIRS